MIVIPAIDLREGLCTQRLRGAAVQAHTETNAVLVARELAGCGFQHLHLSDLDAAAGRGSNAEVVHEIIFSSSAAVMVRGSLVETDQVRDVLSSGARYAVVSSRGIDDLEWLVELADVFPDAVVLAIEAHLREVVMPWSGRGRTMQILDLAEEIGSLALGGMLVTDVDRQRQLTGPDLALMEDLAEESGVPVFAAGGIATMGQLRALEDRSVAGAVIGHALHTGALNPFFVAEEFARD